MCLASDYDIIENWKVNGGHRVTYNAKKYLIIFNVWRLDIL